MASKVDMSLNDLVQFGRKKGPLGKFSRAPQGGAQKTGKFQNKGPSGAGAGGAKPVDLRSVLATKQKSTIGDLRSKLKPKALYTSKHSKSQPSIPLSTLAKSPSSTAAPRRSGQSTRGHPIIPMKPIRVDEPSSPSPPPPPPLHHPSSSRSSRRSDPGPISHKQRSMPSKLPSYDEAKKITVTVPGMRHPPSSSSSELPRHRREERLAAAIAHSKEHRHDSYMRGREEALASAISSAFVGGGESRSNHHHPRERERTNHHQNHHTGSSYHSRSQLRGYSPSPSPPPDVGYDSHYSLPPPPPPPPSAPISRGSAYSSSGGHHSSKGITTLTSMIISNLSDTVSKNDVAELCSAVGPLEGVYMPAAGMAEVVFKYKDDALEAFKKYNQRNLDGQPMVCRVHPTSRSRLSGYGHSYSDDIYNSSHSGFY